MKAAHIFNPLDVMCNKIGLADIDMKLFKLSEHPDIRPCLGGLQTEISITMLSRRESSHSMIRLPQLLRSSV